MAWRNWQSGFFIILCNNTQCSTDIFDEQHFLCLKRHQHMSLHSINSFFSNFTNIDMPMLRPGLSKCFIDMIAIIVINSNGGLLSNNIFNFQYFILFSWSSFLISNIALTHLGWHENFKFNYSRSHFQ